MNKMCPVCGATYGPDVVSCPKHPDERLMLVDAERNFIGQVLDGKYRLVAKLGEGGMGAVYLGVQAQIDREVAVKILRSEFKMNSTAVKRFLREARAASKLSHPNSITVYDFGQAMSGDLYIVMERLTGRSLADVLDDAGPMPVERAVHIMSQICDSLTEAHRLGITHRDLKPENIHIEQKAGNIDFVKVLDFGIAKMRSENEDTHKATQTGMICGTPSYMSPEQAMGRDLDGRSDLYALGILMYELLTNQRPFEGDAAMEVMLKHINEPPPDIFQRTGIRVPVGIQETIEKLLAKDPARRPPNCEEVKRLLQVGLKTPLIGPIDSISDPEINQNRRDQSRATNLEKTGLAPTAPPPTTSDRNAAPGGKSGATRARTLLWVGGFLAAVAGVVVTLALTGAFDGAVASGPVVAVEATGPAEVAGTSPDVAGAGSVVAATMDGDVVEPSTLADDVGTAAEVTIAAAGDVIAAEPLVKAEAVAPDAFEPEPPMMTAFAIDSNPTNASVYEGDVLLGNTPISFSRARETGAVRLQLRMKGYVDKEVALGTVSDTVAETYRLDRVAARRPTTTTLPRGPVDSINKTW